jgi:hypothetical protein
MTDYHAASVHPLVVSFNYKPDQFVLQIMGTDPNFSALGGDGPSFEGYNRKVFRYQT